jgi:hypothetical protein
MHREINEAAKKYYQASICSAKNHRFVDEEVVACDFAAYFYKHQGDEDKALEVAQWGGVKHICAALCEIT